MKIIELTNERCLWLIQVLESRIRQKARKVESAKHKLRHPLLIEKLQSDIHECEHLIQDLQA